MINSKNIIYIISLISTFLCLYFTQILHNQQYEYIYLLPLSLFILSVLFSKNFEYLKHSLVFNVFLIQAVIRYCILPVQISYDGYTMIGFNSKNSNAATFVMIAELISVFFVFHIISTKQYHANRNRSNKIILLENNIPLFILIILMFCYLYFSQYFDIVNPIWNLNEFVRQNIMYNEKNEIPSLAGLLFSPFKAIIALLLMSLVVKSKKIKQKNKKYYLLLLISLLSFFIVGVSRWSILSFAIPLIILAVNYMLDKKTARQLILIIIPFLLFIIISSSIAKFNRQDSQEYTINNIFNVASLNAYFSGIGNIAVGIDAYENLESKNHLSFFINDIFQNVPLASKYTNDKYKSNFVFNKHIYGHNMYQIQIVPLSIAGIFHFDFIGCFIYSSFFLAIAFMFERKSYKTEYIPYKYLYISLAFTLSLVFMLNIGSMVATIIRSLLFILLPFVLIEKIQKINQWQRRLV